MEEPTAGIVAYLCFNKAFNSSRNIPIGNLMLEEWIVRWTEKYSNAGFTELPLVAPSPRGGQPPSANLRTWALAPNGANTV